MNYQLFRKSSIDRVNSPEQLNEYIKVAGPGVWLTLSAIVIFLLGIILWGIFGTIESEIDIVALTEKGRTICYVSREDAEKIKAGMPVEIDNIEGTVAGVSAVPEQLEADTDDTYLYMSGFEKGEFVYCIELSAELIQPGFHRGTITIESIHPISFVIH